MTAQVLWMNIPLIVLAYVLWVGVPMWMVLRHPDRHPRETRTVPAYLRQRAEASARPAVPSVQRQGSAGDYVTRRDLISASRS